MSGTSPTDMPQGDTQLAYRIVARWRAKQAAAIGDPVMLVRQFGYAFEFLAELESKLPEMRKAEAEMGTSQEAETFWRKNISAFRVQPSSAYGAAIHRGARSMFLAILQQYHLPPKIRKVIERGSKAFSRSRVQISKADKALSVYTKTLKAWRALLDAAQQALVQGKPHAEGEGTTKFPAGPFTLINTGGFGDDVMGEAVRVVTRAAQLLTSQGLQRVCYGDILVSNTLAKRNVLAFYLVNKDEMFVRANLKGKASAAVETICHELGHRLHYKFLKSQNREIHRIYNQLAGEDKQMTERQVNDKANHPKPGETMDGYEVTGMKFNRRYERVVELQVVGDPTQKASISLMGWLGKKGELDQAGTFVSTYARIDAEENFAEMVSHYCMGTLPDDQTEMLEALL